MGGKRRAGAGLPRLLCRLDGVQGYAYRAFGAALARDLGLAPSDTALMAEVGMVARCWLEYGSASRALDEARRAREAGKGRRPSASAVDRLAHRAHVAQQAYSVALAALKADPGIKRRVAQRAQQEMMASYRARQRPPSRHETRPRSAAGPTSPEA